MNSGRRDFFKVVGTAAAAAAAASPILKPVESAAALPSKGGFSPGYLHALVLEQTPAGFVRSFDGGETVGIVVKEPVDEYGVVRKHLAGVRYEDIAISFSGGMSPAFYDWIRVFLARDPALHSGSIMSYDYRYKPQTQLDFTDARISEVVFPELNVTSKEAASIDVRLTPGSVQYAVPSLPAPLDTIKKQAKAWPVSTFRLQIGGIDSTTTSRVRKIDAITFRQNAAVASLGEVRTASIDVEPLDIEPIILTISEQFAKPFFDWHRDFLAQGGSQETYLLIESLSPNGKEVLFSLYFNGVGIVRVSRLREDARAEAVRNVEVELYAEQVSFYQGPVPTA